MLDFLPLLIISPDVANVLFFVLTSVKFDMSVPQRCVGPLVTSPQRLLNAPWMQVTKDMGLQWTCECTETGTTQNDMWMWFFFLKKNWLHPSADGVQGSSCTRCLRALPLSGTGNRCWCCGWSWPELTTCRLRNGRTVQTPLKIWSATFETSIHMKIWDEWINQTLRVCLCRYLGCWWWTQISDSQLRTFSTTLSSPSMLFMRCDSSVHTGGSRWASDPSNKVLQQNPKANSDTTPMTHFPVTETNITFFSLQISLL